MKTLILNGKIVTVDTDKISKGLCKIHEEDKHKKTALAFGMLDNDLCKIFTQGISEGIKKEFDETTNDLFKNRIQDFIKEVENEVLTGIYKHIKIIIV